MVGFCRLSHRGMIGPFYFYLIRIFSTIHDYLGISNASANIPLEDNSSTPRLEGTDR